MLHADTKSEDRKRLQDQEQSDGQNQSAERIALHALEQAAFAEHPHQPGEHQARGHGKQVGGAGIRVERNDAVRAKHIEFAMRKVDDAHDAKDQDESDRHEREVARRVRRVQECLEDQLRHVVLRIAAAGPLLLPGARNAEEQLPLRLY